MKRMNNIRESVQDLHEDLLIYGAGHSGYYQ